MKRRLIVCLVAVLVLMLGLSGAAHAADDNLKIDMEFSAYSFTAPKEITVSIKVSNSGERDMPGPVTLYYPNGKQVEEFGSPTLNVGSSKTWSGKWNVTQEQLESGKVLFKVRYAVLNDAGEVVNKQKNIGLEVQYTGAVASVEINRTIAPSTARKGQEVTVTYDVVNTGNVDLTDVVIAEHKSISTKKATIDKVPAGEKASHTFTVTMGTKDLTSQSTITYTVGGKKMTEKKEAATIKYGEVKLSAALAADKKGGSVGDTVKLTLTLKNSGNVDFQNVTVTDPLLGEVFSGQTVPANDSIKLEKEVTIAQSVDYQFSVTGQDAGGTTVQTATDRLSVTAVDPTKKIILTVDASADPEGVMSFPGVVKFTVKVTNNSAVDVSDVDVYASGVHLYNFPTIRAGETRQFVRDVSVTMAGQYRFDAQVKNQLSETETFQSNVIRMQRILPTATPVQTPIVTPEPPQYVPVPQSDGLPEYLGTVQKALKIAFYVLVSLAGAALALLAVGVVRRVQANVQSSQAARGQLERTAYRDYTQPGDHKAERKSSTARELPVQRPIGEDKPAPAVPEVQPGDAVVAQEGDLMAETMRKLYPDQAPVADAPQAADAAPVVDAPLRRRRPDPEA